MIDRKQLFDRDIALRREAKRRLRVLGDLVKEIYSYSAFAARSRDTLVPIKYLKEWHAAYRVGGEDALLPRDWQELSEREQQTASYWYQRMVAYVELDSLSPVDIANFAAELQRASRTGERWLKRYQIGGLWGLTSPYNPEKPQHLDRPGKAASPRDMGALDDDALKVIYKRRAILGELADKDRVSEAEVAAKSLEVDLTARTLRTWLALYRQHGLAGLAPKVRQDAGKSHNLSEEVIAIIRGNRLSHKDWSVRAVWEESARMAAELGETAPTQWQVRRICQAISPIVKVLADGRSDQFRNSLRITYPRIHEGVVYQLDHHKVDVLVKDLRKKDFGKKSGEVRPWLTLVIDAASRRVIAWLLSYDPPNRHTVAAAVRKSLLAAPGGIPEEIWVDNGKDLVSDHVGEMAKALHFHLHICDPHQPQQRGIIERFFETLITRLFSKLDGYVDSNTRDRNPSVKASLTMRDLETELQAFIAKYNSEVHESLGMSPDQFWTENCFALPVEDIRALDVLLLESRDCKVVNHGIKYRNRKYMDRALRNIVGQHVLIRADTRYEAPDEILVFFNGSLLCTAYAVDSERGRTAIRDEIVQMQRDQVTDARGEIEQARSYLKATKQRITENKDIPAPAPASAAATNGQNPPEPANQAEPPRETKLRTSKSKRNSEDNLFELVYRKAFANKDNGES